MGPLRLVNVGKVGPLKSFGCFIRGSGLLNLASNFKICGVFFSYSWIKWGIRCGSSELWNAFWKKILEASFFFFLLWKILEREKRDQPEVCQATACEGTVCSRPLCIVPALIVREKPRPVFSSASVNRGQNLYVGFVPTSFGAASCVELAASVVTAGAGSALCRSVARRSRCFWA